LTNPQNNDKLCETIRREQYSIRKIRGTRFRFEEDIAELLNVKYMVLPPEGDDYWITPVMNIQKDNPFFGIISKFKSDDSIMQDEVRLSN